MPVPIPTTPEDLTAEWLGTALAEGGLPGCEVGAVTTERIGEGVGFIGQLHRLTIEYASAPEGAPRPGPG